MTKLPSAFVVYAGTGAFDPSATGRVLVYDFDPVSAALKLVQELEVGVLPSFMALAADARTLYVTDEVRGELHAFRITDETGTLRPLNTVKASGQPVYVTVDRTGRYLLTTFFEQGQTEVLRLGDSGEIDTATALMATGAESHSVLVDPSNRFVFVPARGANRIAQLVFDPGSGQLSTNEPSASCARTHDGPRHLYFHPEYPWAYVINELSRTISAYTISPLGTLTPLRAPIAAVPSDAADGTSADLIVHPNGHFVYASNRQEERSSIGVFRVTPGTGELSLVGHEPTRGHTPRNFTLTPDGTRLIVANLDSQSLVVFDLDPVTGTLTYRSTTEVPGDPFYVGAENLRLHR